MSRAGAIAVTVAVFAVAIPAAALGSTYRGSGSEDPEMSVKLEVKGDAITFAYSDVLVECANGERLRQGGAIHHGTLGAGGQFNDRFESDGTTSRVRGRLSDRKAVGTLTYTLVYDGGRCHVEDVPWKARRKR